MKIIYAVWRVILISLVAIGIFLLLMELIVFLTFKQMQPDLDRIIDQEIRRQAGVLIEDILLPK